MWEYILLGVGSLIGILLIVLAVAATVGLTGTLLSSGWSRFVLRVPPGEVIAYPKPEFKLLWIPRITFTYGVISNLPVQQQQQQQQQQGPIVTGSYQVLPPPSQPVKSPVMIEAVRLLEGAGNAQLTDSV